MSGPRKLTEAELLRLDDLACDYAAWQERGKGAHKYGALLDFVQSLVSWPKNSPAELASAAAQVDWQQVMLNGGPPCFHIEDDRFCLRAERWDGHGQMHEYIPLNVLLAGSTVPEPRKLTLEDRERLDWMLRRYHSLDTLLARLTREEIIAHIESLAGSTVEAADKLDAVKAEQDKSLAELKEIERLLRTDSSARRYVIYNYVDAAIRARTPEDTPK